MKSLKEYITEKICESKGFKDIDVEYVGKSFDEFLKVNSFDKSKLDLKTLGELFFEFEYLEYIDYYINDIRDGSEEEFQSNLDDVFNKLSEYYDIPLDGKNYMSLNIDTVNSHKRIDHKKLANFYKK